MLEKSNDSLPYNLAFVEARGTVEEVIGHSRLVKVFSKDDACFVESGLRKLINFD